MERISKMWRSALAMALAICMVISFVPVTAFATEADNDVLNYVSFGASNANGYGLSGYMPAGTTAANKNTANVYGYQRMPVESYPYLLAEELNKALGGTTAEYNGNLKETQPFTKVNVSQLAMSSMRIEELRFLLDESYAGDSYTAWRFYGPGSQNWFGMAEDNLETLRAVYQNAIKNADVITLDMGINNFGVYISHQVGNKYGETLEDIDPELAAKYNEAKEQVKELASNYSADAVAMMEQMDGMIDALAYALAGFCFSFDVVMEKIQELNPDAKVVVVSIQNLLTGLSVELEGFEEPLPLGDIFGAVINAANLYTASGSEYSDSYLYADVRKAGRVEFFVDDLLAYNGDPATLTQNEIDCFFVYDESLKAYQQLQGLVSSYMGGQIKTALNDYLGYIAAIYEVSDENALLQAYLNDGSKDFETAKPVLENYGDLGANCLAAMEDAYNAYAQMLQLAMTVASDVLSELFQAGVEDHTIDFTALTDPRKGDVEQALVGKILATAAAAIEMRAGDPNYQFTLSKLYPDGFYETVATEANLPVNLVKSIACMAIRTGIGNSFYGHPNPAGHQEIKDVIWAALKDEITGKDVVEDEIRIVLGELKDFLETYGPKVADQAYTIWVENGYQAKLDSYVAELITVLETRYSIYATEVVPALSNVAAALAGEKDVLTADLVALKAELEAKKAELEAKKAALESIKVETPEIFVPDFSIDTELGNNEQTQVPEKDCTSANELEAAIIDLEHAIAVIEALIADVTADIEDMAALVAEIAETVASLEKTLDDVAAAAQNLKAAVESVVAIISDTSVESTTEAFIAAFNTAREAAVVAADALKIATEAVSDDFAAIETAVGIMEECIADLYNQFDAEKGDILNQLLSVLPAEYVSVAGVVTLAIKDILEENEEAINAALAAKQAEIEAKLNAKLAELEAKLEADKAAAEAELNAKLAALEAEYAPKIAEAEAKLNAKLAEIEAEIAVKAAELEAKAQAEIAALEADAAEKLAALEVELEGYVAELYNATADERATIQAQIDRVNGDIATVKADLACAIGHVENALEEAIAAAVQEINNMYNEAVAQLKKAVADAKAAYEAAVADAKAAYEAAVADAKAAYEAAVAKAKAAAEAAIAEAKAAAEAAIAKAEAAANAAFEQIKATADAALKEIQNIAEAARAELEAAAKAAAEAAAKKLKDLVDNIQIDITMDLSGIQNAIKALSDALLNLDIESITGISFDITGLTDEMLHKATHADLVLTEDSTYVGLGDGAAAAESYVELLGEYLKAEYSIKGYTNYAAAGNTVGADAAKVGTYADVADAELITIGFSSVTLLSNALANAYEDEPADYDWAALVGEDMVPYVEDALNDVYAEIAAAGLGEDLTAMANCVIEGVAYGAVEYVVKLPALVSAIREVNADAVIVILGQYNPMNGVVLSFGGMELDLTEYINYFVEGVTAHGIAYCVLTGEAIFVEAPAVETANTKKEWSETDLIKLLMNGFKSLNPSAAGNVYIENQILAALNITKGEVELPEVPEVPEEPEVLLGDVNGDGVIDLKDLVRMRKYLAEVEEGAEIVKPNADMNGDGEIDLKDLIRIRKLLAEV